MNMWVAFPNRAQEMNIAKRTTCTQNARFRLRTWSYHSIKCIEADVGRPASTATTDTAANCGNRAHPRGQTRTGPQPRSHFEPTEEPPRFVADRIAPRVRHSVSRPKPILGRDEASPVTSSATSPKRGHGQSEASSKPSEPAGSRRTSATWSLCRINRSDLLKEPKPERIPLRPQPPRPNPGDEHIGR